MNREAANADPAGPDTLQGAVRYTGKSVACPFRRAQQQGESLVRAVGEMAVGLRHVAELGPTADDGDRRIDPPRQIGRRVAHVHAAAAFVVGEVAHVVEAAFEKPSNYSCSRNFT